MMKMRCAKCNFELEENQKFCTSCGALIESTGEAGKYFCTECGTKIEPNLKFCTGCGALIKNTKENQNDNIEPCTVPDDCNSIQNEHDPVEARTVGTDCVVQEAGSQTDTSHETQHTVRADDQLTENKAIILEEKESEVERATNETLLNVEKLCTSSECQTDNDVGAIKPQSTTSNDGETTVLQAQATGKYSSNRLLIFAGIAVLVLIFGIMIFSGFGKNEKSSLHVPTPNNVGQQGTKKAEKASEPVSNIADQAKIADYSRNQPRRTQQVEPEQPPVQASLKIHEDKVKIAVAAESTNNNTQASVEKAENARAPKSINNGQSLFGGVPPEQPKQASSPQPTQRLTQKNAIESPLLILAAKGDWLRFDEIAKEISLHPKPLTGDRKQARKMNEEALAKRMSDGASALNLMEKAHSLDPADPEIADNLGLVLRLNNQVLASEGQLLKVIGIWPERAQAWANLAETLSIIGKHEMSVGAFVASYRLSRRPEKTLESYVRLAADPKEDNRTRSSLLAAVEKIGFLK
jgi:tetratricopeptide (TPR) repeat protein